MNPPSNVSLQQALQRAVKSLNEDQGAETIRVPVGQILKEQGSPGNRKGYEVNIIVNRFDEAKPKDLVHFMSDDAYQAKAEKPVSAKKAAKKVAAKKTAKKAAKKVAK